MTSFARYFRCSLFVPVLLATIIPPAARAQLIGDAFRSPLTASLLQTTQQRERERHHRSRDPYMALIEQSAPAAFLRGAASDDPLSPATQAALAQAGGFDAAAGALSPGMDIGMRAGMGMGVGSFAAGLASRTSAALHGSPMATLYAVPGMLNGLSPGCLPSLASLTSPPDGGGRCR